MLIGLYTFFNTKKNSKPRYELNKDFSIKIKKGKKNKSSSQK